MNILFFVEPLIQMDNPNIQSYWLFHHIKIMLESIKKNNKENKCYFVSNNSLTKILKEIDYKNEIEKIYIFSQKELKIFSSSSIETIKKWYNNEYSIKEMEEYKKIFINKFKENSFDVIVTFSPVPYLKEIFNEALVLNYEFGIFSRPPFPITFFLDPIGPGGDSYLRIFSEKILKNVKISKEEEESFNYFLEKQKMSVLQENPFSKKIREIRKKYDKIILLPLQFNNFYLFDLESDYKTQFEYLEDVLIKTSVLENVGILVTQHPSSNFLNIENVKYFRENYKNFIFLEDSINYVGVSQLLIPFVDVVVTVSSSVGYHALIWGKKLVTLGKNYLKTFSDWDNLSNIGQVFKKPYNKEKNYKLLYWLILNYAIPEDYIKNKEWLSNFFKRGIKNINNLENFYQPIDEPRKYFKFLSKKISKNTMNNYFVVYLNIGEGYFEKNSYKLNLGVEKNLKLLDDSEVKTVLLKFHGINLLKLNGLTIKKKNNEYMFINKINHTNSYYEIYPNIFYVNEENFLLFEINSEIEEIQFNIEDYKNIDIKEVFKMMHEKEEKYKEEIKIKEIEKNNIIKEYKKEIEIKEIEKNNIIKEYKKEIEIKEIEKNNIRRKTENLINEIDLATNEILLSKSNKFLHFELRVLHQLFLGSFKEKKKFINWIMRKSQEMEDSRFNPMINLKKILDKKRSL